MDARLLDPSLRFKTHPFTMPATSAPEPEPDPTMPALNDPEAYRVHATPVGAQALSRAGLDPEPPDDLPQEAPAPSSAVSPAQTLARQPAAASPQSKWTAERKAFADKANQAGRAYRQAVEGRRLKRKHMGEYTKLHGQLQASASSLSDLKHMQDTYKDIYTPDSPATMALQKQQIHHFEKVQRLRDELLKKAQHINKRFGVPLDQHGGINEEGDDAGDQEFDDDMLGGYADALMTVPPQ